MADGVPLCMPVFLIVLALLLFDPASESLMQLLTLCSIVQSYTWRRRALFLAERARTRRQYLCRRRTLISQTLVSVMRIGTASDRRMWTRDRPHGDVFMETVEAYQDEEWMSHFRMSRPMFQYLLDLLTPALTMQTTHYRTPIQPRRRLVIALWWYATPGEYRTISCLFGVGISTVCSVIHQVTKAILDTLYKRFICLPQGQSLDDTIKGFVQHGYPQCAGAIDGTHIPIIAPRDNPADYYNRKGWHSIVLQAVVDHKYCFTDVYIGWPGRAHDARVLANSDLYKIAEDKRGGWLFPREKSKTVDGVDIPVHIIGDAAYPLRHWLMKGYTQHLQLSPIQVAYTHTLSSARMVVENAFGRLKGRWRCLMKWNDVDLKFMPHVVAAFCVLHNICELQKEQFPEWTVKDPEVTPSSVDLEVSGGQHSSSAKLIRETICTNLNEMLK
ncbi:putative nuclease HARBI1 [Pseudophryne corroboree]|uniref:putative nuclease HARBI1 n=1 Tax=Pseudophryne corroboree TaxID=495146 RepID=UPI0030812DDA